MTSTKSFYHRFAAVVLVMVMTVTGVFGVFPSGVFQELKVWAGTRTFSFKIQVETNKGTISTNAPDVDENTKWDLITSTNAPYTITTISKYLSDYPTIYSNTISATAKDGYKFKEWKVVSGTATINWNRNNDENLGQYYSSCKPQVTFKGTRDNDKTLVIEAVFEEAPITITYQTENESDVGGYIKTSTSEEHQTKITDSYATTGGSPSGAVAVPNEGYKFDGWYKGGTKVSSTPTFTPTSPADGDTYTAKFVAYDITLRIKANEQNITQTKYFDKNSTGTFAVTPDFTGSKDAEHYTFEKWTIEENTLDETLLAGATDGNGTLNIDYTWFTDNGTYTIVANFKMKDGTALHYEAVENGTVTPAMESFIVPSDANSLTGAKAEGSRGYKFEGWYKVVKTTDDYGEEKEEEVRISGDALLKLTEEQLQQIMEDTTFRAKFIPYSGSITYTADDGGTVTKDYSGFDIDDNTSIASSVAQPSENMVFDKWQLSYVEEVTDEETGEVSQETHTIDIDWGKTAEITPTSEQILASLKADGVDIDDAVENGLNITLTALFREPRIDLFGNFKVNAENYRWHKSM